MNCETVCENIVEYIKNKVSENDMKEIKEHLEKCEECRIYFNDCKKLLGIYPNFEKDFTYPADLEEKIKKSLEKTSVL